MSKLIWTVGDGRREFTLKAETQIGRGLGSDIQLFDPLASTFHARIMEQNGAWVIEDNHSTNGTYVNGERRQRSVLRNGDVITIGEVELTFDDEPPAVSTTVFLGKDAVIPWAQASGKESGSGRRAKDVLDAVFRDEASSAHFKTSSLRVSADLAGRLDKAEHILERRLKTSYEISKAAAATLNLPEIMDRILAALFEIFETADRAFIFLLDPDTREAASAAVRRRVPHDAGEIALSRTALQEAMDKQEAILCVDALSDARYSDAMSIVSQGIRSMMIAPLVFQEQALGAIYVDTRHAIGQFDEADLELLTVAAGQAAGSVVNARLHEKVVKSERLAAIGETVAGLTHCIKNILQGIKGGVYIVDKALAKGNAEGVSSGWEMVKRNNVFMEELVFDLLSYSKQRQPEYRTADVNELCRDVCALAAARADDKGVGVAFNPDPALGPVQIDPTGIRRCLLNLAMNAVDACEENKGSVAVATESPQDGFLRITVRDTGCGMSEETKAKLFTVFFSTKRSKGTGLGLPVAKKIVEEHGGRIELISQEGQGTTFTICLPPAPDQKGASDDGQEKESADCGR